MKKQYRLVRILKKYKLRSFFSQLILMIVALVTVLTAISVSILFFLRKTMIEREKEIQEANLEYATEQLEGVISSAYQSIYSIIGSSYVVDGLFAYDRVIDSYEEDKNITDIIQRLYLVYQSNENIRNVFIIQEEKDFVVDQNGIMDRILYFQRFEDDMELWAELEKGQRKFTLRMSADSSSIYVLHPMYSRNKRFATLCMELDMDRLHDMEAFHKFVEGRIVCVTDMEDNIIGYLSEDRDSELIGEAIRKGGVKGYLFLGSDTIQKELSVVALTPMFMVTGKVTTFFAVSLAVFTVSVISGIAASVSIGGRLYRPLCHAVELIEVAGKRGGADEFKTIEHNVNAILERNRDMASFVERSTPIVLETIFRSLIMGAGNEKDFQEMLETLDMYDMISIEVDSKYGYYMVAVIYGKQGNGDMERIIDSIFSDRIVSLFERHEDEYVMILYLREEVSREEVVEQCEKLREHTDALIAVGKRYRSLYHIGKSYNDALSALNKRRALQSEEVFDAESDYDFVGYDLPGDTESVLRRYVVAGKGQSAVEAIKESLGKNLERGISFQEYQRLVSVYEDCLMKMLENTDKNICNQIEPMAFHGTAFRMQTMEKRVEMMLGNYLILAGFYDREMHAEPMERILDYIEKHMEEDIGLDDVAAATGLTPNYITKYFKNKSGMNFKSFLTGKRIEMAKQLLTGTQLTVKEIAAKCGYNSSKQLIANFTKITGITPTEYRKVQLYGEKNRCD